MNMRIQSIIISSVLLSACAYGGVGLPGSPAWKMTASPEDQSRYYNDSMNREKAKIGQYCIAAGLTPNTEGYYQCCLRLANARVEQQEIEQQQRAIQQQNQDAYDKGVQEGQMEGYVLGISTPSNP